MEPALEMRDVVKYYGGDKPVLNGVSFRIFKGETKIIIGASGSGKSTILKLIMGLEKPDEGQILVEGEEITRLNEQQLVPVRQKIGMVFQESALFDSLTVRENVAYRLYELNANESEIDTRVREVLGFVGLVDAIDKMPSELSGGMKRRVALARALIGEPGIMLYDEPTAGLDPVTSNTIVELIMKQRDVYRTSSLLVTHRLQDAFTMATHEFDPKANELKVLPKGQYCNVPMSFLILRDGKVTFDGDIRQLAHTKDEYIREYIS